MLRFKFGNVGVVGPKTWGDGFRPGLLTLDCVHRTHLAIFRHYYPPSLFNWFIDDWISFAYVNRSHRIRAWETRHVFTRRRYRPAMAQKRLLPGLLQCGSAAITSFLHNRLAHVPVLCGSVPARPRMVEMHPHL